MKENEIYNLCKKIHPIYRSITGKGNKKTLRIFKRINPKLKIIQFKSGKKVFDWKVPKVWVIRDAWIKNIETKKKILSFKKNFLSVMSYSVAINKIISLAELKKKIFSLKTQPNETPYVTSYYKKNWAFCMPDKLKKNLNQKKYRICIDSKFENGYLQIGEIYLPGRLKKEILLSSYICHPQMASNELSSPSILIYISKWLNSYKNRKYSYRILFSSETIGTICYINKKLDLLKKNVIGGYVLTCLGDDNRYSYLKSKSGNSISDRIALDIFKNIKKKKIYSWLQRGSDERQFNSPGVELNLGSIMRSKYQTYKEYHTSADKLGKFVTKRSLNQSYNFVKKILLKIEKSIIPISQVICEPQLSKRNLYSHIHFKNFDWTKSQQILDFISYSNGQNLLQDIAKKLNISEKKALLLAKKLKKHNLIDF